LAAQQDAMQAQLLRTHDCSLIRKILAFNRSANAKMARAIAATNGECSQSAPTVSEAQLEAILRAQCASGAAPRVSTPTIRTANPAVRGGPSVKVGNPAVGGATVNVTEPSVLQPTRP
jgi:hypothetical protein